MQTEQIETTMPAATLSALPPFIALLASYRYWLLLGFVLTVATLFASVGLLTVSGWFLTGTALAGGTAELTAIAYNFFQPAATVRGFAVGRTAGRWAERVVNHEATFRLLATYRTWLFAGLAPLSPQQRGRYHGATLLNRITRDIDALDNLYVRLLLPVLAALLLMSAMTAVATLLLPTLLLPFGVLLVAGFVIFPVLAWRLGRRLAPEFQRRQQRLRVDLLELVDGLETLSLRQQAWQTYRQRALTNSGKWLQTQWQLHKRATLMSNALALLIGLMALAALAAMSYSDLDGVLIGGATLLVLACGELLVLLPDAWLRLPGTCASAAELTQLRNRRAEIVYPEKTLHCPRDSGLQLENVGFSYDNLTILQQINFSLPAGTHCLLQGSSGGGKTTLMRLLTRQLREQGGEIRLGDVLISDFAESDWRSRVAFAPQDTYLFTDTLANNLRLAKADASDDDLWQVLTVVGLADFVGHLPQGLQTWTDESGANLSGGQRRRLGIARALLLTDADWVILDEPSEGLDVDSESALIADVTTYLRGKTLLWVSHRNTCSHQFDCVAHLSEGVLR